MTDAPPCSCTFPIFCAHYVYLFARKFTKGYNGSHWQAQVAKICRSGGFLLKYSNHKPPGSLFFNNRIHMTQKQRDWKQECHIAVISWFLHLNNGVYTVLTTQLLHEWSFLTSSFTSGKRMTAKHMATRSCSKSTLQIYFPMFSLKTIFILAYPKSKN